MKSMVCRLGIVLTVAAMLVPFTSFAQAVDPINVKIPFAFVVQGRTMNAGAYKLTPVSAAGTPFWELRSEKDAIVFGAQLPLDNRYSDPARLTFQCYDGKCFLSEIHAIGDWKLPASQIGRASCRE